MKKIYIGIFAFFLATVAGAITINGPLVGAKLENQASDPNGTEGRIYQNTTTHLPKFHNGTSWSNIRDGGAAASFTGSLSGDVTGTQGSTAISASTVTGKLITGFVSGSGTVAATDTVLQSINKLDGNIALKSPIAGPTFTGTLTAPTIVGSDATDAASSTSAPMKTAGGLACAKKLFVGTDASVGGTLGVTGTTTHTGNVGIGMAASASIPASIKGASSLGSLGSEKILATADSDFSSDTGKWTGTGWVIGSGVATHTAGANAITLDNSALDSAPASGRVYQVTFTVVTTTPGYLQVSIAGANGYAIGQANGTVTGMIQNIYGASTAALKFTPDASWAGTIDDISVKEITLSSIALQIQSSDGTSTPIDIRGGGSAKTNVFMGTRVGEANISGTNNVAIGHYSMQVSSTGASNTAVGASALQQNASGNSNASFGTGSLSTSVSSSNNSAFGNGSGQYATGANNVFIGLSSGKGASATSPNSANANTFVGYTAGVANSVSTGGVFLGNQSGLSVTSGNNNTLLGSNSGDALTTGSGNIRIGQDADGTKVDAVDSIAIGRASRANHDNAIVIGQGVTSAADYEFILGGTSHLVKVPGKLHVATQTPASASAACTAGQIAWDASYMYVCVATNTWKRSAIATW